MRSICDEAWRAFSFPRQKGKLKASLYGRMWRLREAGYDAMVRQHEDAEYVLVVRKFI